MSNKKKFIVFLLIALMLLGATAAFGLGGIILPVGDKCGEFDLECDPGYTTVDANGVPYPIIPTAVPTPPGLVYPAPPRER
jgi:hypothetical protein